MAGSTIGSPGYGVVTFTPDATGRTALRTDQQGDTCSFAYDLAGRLLTKAYVGHASGPLAGVTDTDTFTYDGGSRMLTAISGRYANTVAYTYDNAGRKATESLTMGGQTYSIGTDYDLTGQVSRLTYPDGTEVDRTYSERGQLATIAFNGTTIDTRTYDDGGRMLTSSYNNGVSESRTYNIDNTLASINFTGAPIGNLTYGWDANKNKTSEGISGTMSGYGFNVGGSGYDEEDRLVNWQRSDNNLNQAWNLSLVGDWNSITENASTQSRTHGPTHELLTAAGQAVQHDVKGNMTHIPANLRPTTSGTPQPLSLTWDFDNRLVSADTNNDSTADVFYKWDALGRRVLRDDGTTATVYVQSGQQTIADYTAGTTATTPTYNYLYASYIDEPVMRTGSGNSIYLHRNQQYSITAITNGSGTITERYAYNSYGTPTIADGSGTTLTASADNNRYTYTGREYDEVLSLYHYRARMYDSVAGRFCSRDPIGFDGSVWNTYSYVSNNSGSRLDPSGKSFFGTNGNEQADFGWWSWYFSGNGQYLNLNTMSPTLWNAWANSPITQGFVNEMKGYITPPNPLDGDCDTTTSGYVSSWSKVDYAPGNGLWQAATDTLFAIGNTTLEGMISCTTTTTCTEHVYEEVSNCADSGRFVIRNRCQSKQCSGIVTLSDAFVDVLDRHDETPGNQEFPGGVGYSFGATFSFSMNFPQTCTKTNDFDYGYWD